MTNDEYNKRLEAALKAARDNSNALSVRLAEIATVMHYPECWDTMAYPTLLDAIREVFQCSDERHNIRPEAHYWAKDRCSGDILVVKTDSALKLHACGPWEREVPKADVELLCEIARPQGYEKTKLYYEGI